jgi:Domain of unknown function (DUF4833)
MRRRLPAVLALAVLASDTRGDETCGPLFVIARSLNANVVLYEAHFKADGTLDSEKPLKATWRLDAQDGRREGLNFVERIRAYGFDLTAIGQTDAWRVKVRALPARPLVLHAGTGCPFVTAEVDGRTAILRRVYVTATGGLLPKVASVELTGVDRETALPVTERFTP